MAISRTPWGKNDLQNTSPQAAKENWAYWQNRINRASLVMLREQNIITAEQAEQIAKAQRLAEEDQKSQEPFYDIMPLEKLLIKYCGQEATWIHTGRSRQDIFATLFQARLRRAVLDSYEKLNQLRALFLKLAKEHVETWMPAYTNGVQAMPISLAFYLSAFLESFERDADRFEEAWRRVNLCALGTGVLACSGWNLNRERLAQLLGFDGPIVNGLDSSQVSLFDIPLEAAGIASNIAVRISVLAQDLAQQYSQTRPWMILDDSDAYGSSAMPQKRNPGILNKTRARASDVLGAMSTAYFRDHNIALGMYDNKDSVNEDNAKVFVYLCSLLDLTIATFSMVRVNKERALEELENDWTCTMALAEQMQKHYGVPFRVGHNFASDIVTKARKNGWYPKTFPFEEAVKSFEAVTEKLEGKAQPIPMKADEFYRYLDPEYVIKSRVGKGAPNPESVKDNLEKLEQRLTKDKEKLAQINEGLEQAKINLDRAFEQLVKS